MTSRALSSNGRNSAAMRPPSWASRCILQILLGTRVVELRVR
jgi:hypothetical protein